MSQYLENSKTDFNKIVDFFKKDLNSLRIGRAAPSILENVRVEAYGTMTPLIQLASVQTPDPHSLIIQPWDKSLLKAIEKGIEASDLGLNAVVDQDVIRINIPSMTEETRKEVVKKLHQKLEEAKIVIKNSREKSKEEIISKEKNKEISEDDKFKLVEGLDNSVKEYNALLKSLADKKEEEIMSL